ncbi:carbohydrate ABC transporter permease [Paractinoplanes ferrugineus]|uniref:ABC transporter permease n=1 Tax=Paractinoplanes ferrugineus TaxID=113564 RepID=A0A919J8I4_9ACTN|nr:carbohydrate ABC transporter permease [Actinoplanes ferrugineus]GIE16073.1 ABC transporter permease [Actinoplanes ferrugineus]
MTATALARAAEKTRRNRNRPPWEEPPTAAGQAGKGAVLAFIVLVVLIPLYMVVLTSLSTQGSINQAGGMVLVPHGITVEAYHQIFTNNLVISSLIASLGITAVGTLLSVVVTVLCAYGLSRYRSWGHRPILMLLVVTMFFNGGLIPTFMVVAGLGGYDNFWALILPSAVSVFNILVMRGFFANTSRDLIDAAYVDGAGEWRILTRIVLPTSRAVVAVISLFYAVGYWNTFFNALLYLPDNQKWPLQLVIYTYTLQGNPMPGMGVTQTGTYLGAQQIAPLSIQMAVVTLTLIPILIIYPFVQRHFAKGMLLGAVKG